VPNTWICRAAEVAANNSMITRANTIFRPEDFVTKSEALAMMLTAVCMEPVTAAQVDIVLNQGQQFSSDTVQWQKNVLVKYNNYTPVDFQNFGPNLCATRSEVFDFASTLLDYTAPNGQCKSSICYDLDLVSGSSLFATYGSVETMITSIT